MTLGLQGHCPVAGLQLPDAESVPMSVQLQATKNESFIKVGTENKSLSGKNQFQF
jgi:hypothetical protein